MGRKKKGSTEPLHIRRNITLPAELDKWLKQQDNASALITDLLRAYRAGTGDVNELRQGRFEVVSQRDGRTYRFDGTYLLQGADGIYYQAPDGSLVFVANDHHPERVPLDEVQDWFGTVDPETVPRVLIDAFGLEEMVDLTAGPI